MGMINISEIVNDKNMKKNLHTKFNKSKTNFNSIYIKTIQSNLFNHKEFIGY